MLTVAVRRFWGTWYGEEEKPHLKDVLASAQFSAKVSILFLQAKALFHCPGGNMAAGSNPQFSQDVADVSFDSAFGDYQGFGNFAVRVSPCYQARHCPLAPGQPIELFGLGLPHKQTGFTGQI